MAAPDVPLSPPVAPVAAPASPATTPVDAAPVTPTPATPEAPKGPLSRREAKEGLIRGVRDAIAVTETPAPVASEPPAHPPTDTSVPGTTPPTEAGVAAPSAPVVPAYQPVRVAVPEGHPLREMGVEYFTAESPQHERAIRATINSYTRRSEVETLRAQLDTNAREKAAVEAREAAQKQWVNRPEYQERITKYHAIKEAIGQAEADLFWQGANAELVQIEQQELTTRMGKLDESARQQAAQAWVDEAYAQTATLPALVRTLPQFGQWFQEAVDTFDARMERGHFDSQLRAISDATTRQAEMHRLFFADLGAA